MNSHSQNHVLQLNPINGYDGDDDDFWRNSYEALPPPQAADDQFSLCFNEENDYSDATLKFINDMLMEENDDLLETAPSLLHDMLALQATERSFYDALHDSTPQQNSEERERRHREKKNRLRQDDDLTEEEQRSNKQLAGNVDDEESLEMYDNVLLSSDTNSLLGTHKQPPKARRAKKQGVTSTVLKEFVDLRSLLKTCVQAMENLDTMTAVHLLLQIRPHCSPQGDSLERVVHYFANALEARLAGTGATLYAAIKSKRRSAADILKAYKMTIKVSPIRNMSCLLANKSIEKLATGATALHIIDFGIMYGFQWPSLIQHLSERRGGPPKLRMTGIEFPQKGPRPAECIEETGRRLAKYCERFGVPFEYNAIAQQWETIRVEDLKIDKDELLVVSCLYRLHHFLDETVVANISPRDAVLNLIKNSNPDMFIHGVTNGRYDTAYFTRRFTEAFFHFCNKFEMFETMVDREDESRLLFEEQFYGSEIMNIIACEGTERVERPESYKHWQFRMRNAGLRQLPLDQEMVKYVRIKVKTEYHKEFTVDEDGKWMLQGWKGRVIDAISCWKPGHG